MLADIRKNAKIVMTLVIVIAVCVLCVVLCLNSDKIGAKVGAAAGKAVGMAVGSFDGVTEGLSTGYQDGKAEGLSAKDTEAEVKTKVHELGNLRVLAANVEIPNHHEVGKKGSALDVYCGSAVFSVDLTQAEITRNADGEVTVILPVPTADVNIDISRTKRLAEYQSTFFNGSAGDGIDAYLNTLKTLNDFTWDKVSNYDTLMTMAKDSAVKQVTRVTEGVCVDCSGVDVKFRSEN
jgi:hypothetical protein